MALVALLMVLVVQVLYRQEPKSGIKVGREYLSISRLQELKAS